MKLTRLTAQKKGKAIQLTGQFRGRSGYRVRLRLADVTRPEDLQARVEALLNKDLTVKEARGIGRV